VTEGAERMERLIDGVLEHSSLERSRSASSSCSGGLGHRPRRPRGDHPGDGRCRGQRSAGPGDAVIAQLLRPIGNASFRGERTTDPRGRSAAGGG
jgi:hypothetical protein